MRKHTDESVAHTPFDFLKNERIPSVTDIRAGYRAWVRAYWNGDSCHYVAAMEMPVRAGGAERTALIRYSYHTEPQGFRISGQARDAAWAFMDDHWVGRTAEQVRTDQDAAGMARSLLHNLAYVGDELESPVTWHCRACEAVVSPEGRVEHTEYCVVGKAEIHIAGDLSYGPPAGDAGLEEFFAG